MAWKIRITDVDYTEPRIEGDPPEEVDFDLSDSGRYRTVAEYFDDADPGTILYTEEFVFYKDQVSSAEALEKMKEKGRIVRDTRELVETLSGYIGNSYAL